MYIQPLLYDMKALNIFQINLFHIINFTFKCKKKIFTPKPENKYNIQSRGKLIKPFARKKTYPTQL